MEMMPSILKSWTGRKVNIDVKSFENLFVGVETGSSCTCMCCDACFYLSVCLPVCLSVSLHRFVL